MRHFDQCHSFKDIPNVILPKERKTFKFNAIHAREKAPFVCYFDTGSLLLPNTDVKNPTHTHDIVSYKYLLVDEEGKIVANKREKGAEILGCRMIDNITKNFK